MKRSTRTYRTTPLGTALALVAAAVLAVLAAPAKAQFDGFGPYVIESSVFTLNNVPDNAVLVVDLNHDGLDDLVTWGVPAAFESRVVVRINNGTDPVSFTQTVYDPFGINSPSADQALAGDFNGDGWNDIFLIYINASGLRTMRVAFGDGSGALSFGPNQSITIGSTSNRGFALDDVDRDGDLDVVYYESANSVRIDAFYNDGTGIFDVQERIISESLTAGGGLEIADVDGDGVNEIILHTAGNDRAIRVFDRPDTSGVYQQISEVVVTNGMSAIDSGDVDGDGDIDVVVAENSSTGTEAIQILENDGLGNFTVTFFGGSRIVDIHFVDFDGDGSLDLGIVRDNGGSTTRLVRVRLNDGTGIFGPFMDTAAPNLSALPSASFPDLDGNGTPDLAFRQPGIFVHALNLTPIFAPGPFALSIPADNATDLALPEHITGWQINQPKFTWGVPTGFSVTYDLSISTTGGDPVEVYSATGIAGPSHPVPSGILVPGIEYAWEVTAVNPIGSSVAPAFTFTMAPGPNPCPPDFNGDGSVDTLDFLAFLNAWSAGCP